MAVPLKFTPKPADPHVDLERQLAGAQKDSTEAILVAYDILRTAHANGTLDLVQGLVGGRDIIAAKVAEYAKLPEGIAGIRNALAMAKILTTLDPDTLDNLAKAMDTAVLEHATQEKPPSFWQIFKRATSEDSRRGLSFMVTMLMSFGRAIRKRN